MYRIIIIYHNKMYAFITHTTHTHTHTHRGNTRTF